MRYLFILMSLFFLSFMCDRPTVKVIDATSQSWHGGVKGSGRGVNYRVSVIVGKDSDVLSFDSLWVGDRGYPVQASRPHPFTSADGFHKNDTVTIYASMHQAANPDGDLIPLPVPSKGAPVSYEGDALLSFKVKQKQFYVVVKEFRRLEQLDYP